MIQLGQDRSKRKGKDLIQLGQDQGAGHAGYRDSDDVHSHLEKKKKRTWCTRERGAAGGHPTAKIDFSDKGAPWGVSDDNHSGEERDQEV